MFYFTDAACVTMLGGASLTALHAAKAREASKTTKYADLAQSNDYELKIAAVEVSGAFGTQLNQIIARTAYLHVFFFFFLFLHSIPHFLPPPPFPLNKQTPI